MVTTQSTETNRAELAGELMSRIAKLDCDELMQVRRLLDELDATTAGVLLRLPDSKKRSQRR